MKDWTSFLGWSIIVASILSAISSSSAVYLICKYRNEEFIRIRNIYIMLIDHSVPAIILLSISWFAVKGLLDPYTNNKTRDEHAGYLLTTVSLAFYFYGIVTSFVSIPNYAKIRLTNDTEDWKTALDENYSTWVMEKWNIVGNHRRCLIIGLCVWSVYAIPQILVSFVFEEKYYVQLLTYAIMNVFLTLGESTLLIIMSKHLMPYNDVWFMRQEMDDSVFLGIFFCTTIGIDAVYLLSQDVRDEVNPFVFSSINLLAHMIMIITLNIVYGFTPIYLNLKSPIHIQVVETLKKQRLRRASNANINVNMNVGNNSIVNVSTPASSNARNNDSITFGKSISGGTPSIKSLSIATVNSASSNSTTYVKSKAIAPRPIARFHFSANSGSSESKTSINSSITDIHNKEMSNVNFKRDRRQSVSGVTLLDTFSDSTIFDRFMNHLCKEYTSENMLFLIYLLQYQNFLIESGINIDIDNDGKQLIYRGQLKLPQCVPVIPLFEKHKKQQQSPSQSQSQLQSQSPTTTQTQTLPQNDCTTINLSDIMTNYGSDKMLNILKGFIVIYEKFIKRGSAPFEINVSDSCRNQVAMWYYKLIQFKQGVNHKRIMTGLDLKLDVKDFEIFNDDSRKNDYDFDFLELWESLMVCSKQVIALISQSVVRYFVNELMNA